MLKDIKEACRLAEEKLKEIDSAFVIITGTEKGEGDKGGLISCADGLLYQALLVEALTNEDFRKVVVKLGAELADEDKVAKCRKLINEENKDIS
jgi:hypothetical protein